MTKKSTVASVNKAKQDQMQWKKNTFTSIGGEDAENEKENVGQETSEKEKESAPVAEDDETRQKRLNAVGFHMLSIQFLLDIFLRLWKKDLASLSSRKGG